jgi:hypothetical protein
MSRSECRQAVRGGTHLQLIADGTSLRRPPGTEVFNEPHEVGCNIFNQKLIEF